MSFISAPDTLFLSVDFCLRSRRSLRQHICAFRAQPYISIGLKMEKNTINDNFNSNIGDRSGHHLTEHDFPDRLGPHFREDDVVEFPAKSEAALNSTKKVEEVSKQSCRAVTLSCYVISVTAILYAMEKLIGRDEFWNSAATFLYMLNCTHEK